MNKYETAKFEQYKRSEMRSLRDAYGSCSKAKENAWDYCVNLMLACNGSGLKVLTKNTFMFTAGFMYTDTEGRDCFVIITPTKNVVCWVEG